MDFIDFPNDNITANCQQHQRKVIQSFKQPLLFLNMPTMSQKDQRDKASRSFDLGSIDALPSMDLASGIFEAPDAIQLEGPSVESQPISVTGEPLDKQVAAPSTAPSKVEKSRSEAQEAIKKGGRIRKPKDTAGASAMIL
ncbi:hypothetical protein AAE478_002095 [Parahypoxylon ruwenzoriense]